MRMKALPRSDTCSASAPPTPISSRSSSSSASSSSWIYLRSLLIIASSTPVRDKGSISSSLSRVNRKHGLSFQHWVDLFSSDGKLLDKSKLLRRVRSGGIEPGIRAEVWPFLLGLHDFGSTEAERTESRTRRREEYQKLREQCQQFFKCGGADDPSSTAGTTENYATWRRIIHLDAVRAEWVPCAATHVVVTDKVAHDVAEAAELRDYDHLDPGQLHHAARLVMMLEAYAVYDPETGYCQGMTDLLSPIATVMEDDAEAFWCFTAFMFRARHNFRLDEVGIHRQLGMVARIIHHRDATLFRHLECHQAADCAFAYRMVVVLLRRELSFEQTLCLWEVLWADQAAVRTGMGWRRHTVRRQRLWDAPPTEDLLLYAIAACVLQRREIIMGQDFGMEEIQRECNAMAGQLDVWRLLDEAHRLVLSSHGKI